jgi:hypothetical protein
VRWGSPRWGNLAASLGRMNHVCFLCAPVKAGMVLLVKARNVEGLATHNGSESCAAAGNRRREALTGVCVGQVLSRERNSLRSADPVKERGRPHRRWRHGKLPLGSARSETLSMRECTMCGSREIPRSPVADGGTGRIGKSKDVRR